MIMEENMIVIRDPKTFYLDFDWPKDVDENLKYEIELIIKSNECLAENKIENEIKHLLLKYKLGRKIHKYGKPTKRMNHINLFLTCHKD